MKKFYTMVTTHQTDNGWEIHLDGRSVKTPSANIISVPDEEIANHIAKEWMEQIDTIQPDTMPLTQFVTTALDRSTENRDEITAQTLQYLDTDLLCYRTDHPEDIGKKQADIWDPALKSFEELYGFALGTTTGLTALQQPDALKEKIANEIESLDLWRFTALQMTTAMTGSIVLALLFIHQKMKPDELIDATFVEEIHKSEIYNEEKYGRDPQTKKKMKSIHSDLAALETFLACT